MVVPVATLTTCDPCEKRQGDTAGSDGLGGAAGVKVGGGGLARSTPADAMERTTGLTEASHIWRYSPVSVRRKRSTVASVRMSSSVAVGAWQMMSISRDAGTPTTVMPPS